MKLSLHELRAVLTAVSDVSADLRHHYSETETAALDSAEKKLKNVLVKREQKTTVKVKVAKAE